MTDEVKSILHRVWGMKADAMMRGLEVQPRLFGAEGEAGEEWRQWFVMTSDNAVRDTSMDRLIYGPWIGQGWDQVPHHPNVMVRANSVLRVHPMEERGEVNRRLQDVRELVDAGAPLLAPRCRMRWTGKTGIPWPPCGPGVSRTRLLRVLSTPCSGCTLSPHHPLCGCSLQTTLT